MLPKCTVSYRVGRVPRRLRRPREIGPHGICRVDGERRYSLTSCHIIIVNRSMILLAGQVTCRHNKRPRTAVLVTIFALGGLRMALQVALQVERTNTHVMLHGWALYREKKRRRRRPLNVFLCPDQCTLWIMMNYGCDVACIYICGTTKTKRWVVFTT